MPVLIYGETGTGKELFAKAIHQSSDRSTNPFITVNCGAIPKEIVDTVLFGHKKGAFTGANNEHKGFFEEADKGTIFLDEFGELSPEVQVRLLRVLQEGKITPVGSNSEIKIDVRVIAATHRDLMQMVAEGNFREDLFYRIAVGILQLPPLREREGDLLLISDSILNNLRTSDESLKHKYFSVSARNVILKQSWRGNIRELQSTILRATLWSEGNTITDKDIENSLFKIPDSSKILTYPKFTHPIDLNNEISKLSTYYIQEALIKTNNNKTKAAELLGLKNYQTLNNWIEKYNIN